MFRTLARLLNDPTLTNPNATYSEQVFRIHPYQLSQWLEQAWGFAEAATFANIPGQQPFLGDPGIVGAFALPTTPTNPFDHFLRSGIRPGPGGAPVDRFSDAPSPGENPPLPLPWEHLLYAYLIENTGVIEILGEIVRRFGVGETLETPSLDTQRWLRATEELFFKDPPLFHVSGLTSQLRPDLRVARRNAYWRLLGMDLSHAPTTGGAEQSWKRDVGVANVRFHELWVEFLRAIWTAIENAKNSSGPNPTDDAYVLEVSQYMRDLLQMRRRGGNLAREEFIHVSTLSWFHLTVDLDSPVVIDLRAQGTDAADRLIKLGDRVGIRPPAHARELFEMAELASGLVRFIELGYFNSAVNVQALYATPSQLRDDVQRIIDLWEMATGATLKASSVRVVGQGRGGALPARSLHEPPPHRPASRPRVSTNGSRAETVRT